MVVIDATFAVAKSKPEKFRPVRDFFFQASFSATAKVASITAMIFFHIILHPAVLIYDFHIFITSVSSL